MNPRRTGAVAGLFAACLGVISGCANRHDTATALSAVIPVSSPAVASPAGSSSAVASPAATSSGVASTQVRDSTQIYGAVTADSERELVLTYLGGDCDISASGSATERGSAITVRVTVKSGNVVCDAVGYIRTAVAKLSAPLGDRVVHDATGATVPVIDGALVLRPTWLPDGYQGGTLTAGSPTDGKAQASQVWTPPDATETTSPGAIMCRPEAAGSVALVQGYGINPGSPKMSGEYALADGTSVDVVRDDQGGLGLYWPPPGHPSGWTVALGSEPTCSGSAPLPLDTLLRIASGLR